MDIFQLEAFVEIAKQGNITRAAEKLFLTQPTVTHRLRCLETEFGQPLFTRVPHGVVLTEAGRMLLPYATRALQELKEGKTALRHLRDASGGSLIIWSVTSISMYLVPTLLQRFSQEYPAVDVVIRSGHTQEIIDRVVRQDVQIGMVYYATHPEVDAHEVYEDEVFFVAHPDHPFCKRDAITVEEIVSEPLVMLGGYYSRTLEEIFTSRGLKPPIARYEVDNVEVAKKMVEAGQGISLLQGITVRRELELGLLKAIQIPQLERIPRKIYFISHKTGGLGGITRAFMNIAESLNFEKW